MTKILKKIKCKLGIHTKLNDSSLIRRSGYLSVVDEDFKVKADIIRSVTSIEKHCIYCGKKFISEIETIDIPIGI